MSILFKSVQTPNKHRMYFAASYLQGISNFDYVNVRDMTEGNSIPENVPAFKVAFKDETTNKIYENNLAEIYSSPLQFIGFSLGYSYEF